MNRKTITGSAKDAAVITVTLAATVPALGLLLALGAADWLRDRAPVPVLRFLTWGKQRQWKRKGIPADPYPFAALEPKEHLALAYFERD